MPEEHLLYNMCCDVEPVSIYRAINKWNIRRWMLSIQHQLSQFNLLLNDVSHVRHATHTQTRQSTLWRWRPMIMTWHNGICVEKVLYVWHVPFLFRNQLPVLRLPTEFQSHSELTNRIYVSPVNLVAFHTSRHRIPAGIDKWHLGPMTNICHRVCMDHGHIDLSCIHLQWEEGKGIKTLKYLSEMSLNNVSKRKY